MDSIKHQNPLYTWKERISEDGVFTKNRVAATNKILETFLDNLSKSKDNTDVWKCVEKAVKSLNKLNKTEDYFIDVAEREELIQFMQIEAEKSGLKFAGDITSEWRDEW